MTKLTYYFYILLLLLLSINAQSVKAEALYQVNINEDDIILLDIVLNNETVAQSIDAYKVDDKLMLAIEPLFDALNIRYAISKNSVTIWKDETEHNFTLNGDAQSTFRWASDDFYLFTDLALFQLLFPAKMDYLPKRLKLQIKTPEKELLFPFQKIKQQNKRRRLEQALNGQGMIKQAQIPITIQDEYQLFTLPHGRINIAAEQNNENSGLNTSIQLTSDFLYHSAELTLSDTNHTDFDARLNFSRYKTSPDDYILGVYDQYQVGDISGQTNSLTTSTSSGLGVNFARRPEGYRPSNQNINIEETAPPGWEAELFHNNIFLETVTVPTDGLLVFENVEVFYGQNTYLIKLYGPYGEKDVITKVINLTENALSKGEFAHFIYGLDNNHRLIKDKSDKDYELTNYGASVDYGISDTWQLGLGYTGLTNNFGIDNNKQFFNLKNAFTLPGLLLENDISFDQDGNHAQLTTLKGSAFEKDTYTLSFESAKDFQSGKVSAVGQQFTYQGSYSKSMGYTNLGFNASYTKDERRELIDASARISGNFNLINYNNTFTYLQVKNLMLNNDSTSNKKTDRFIGSLGVSGNLPYDFRVSGVIDYEPEADDIILDSSSIRIQKKFLDYWETTNYLTFDYLPLKRAQNTAKWRFSHRVAWQAESFQLNLSSGFDETKNWSVQIGLQFFLGYDHRNNTMLFNKNMTSNTATLDVHTYLDRQLNGVYDPLDYNLSGVSFSGQNEWENTKTSDSGRIVLPGVYAATPFSFTAKWKDGSSTINNDYVVYTHPGAYIGVNMPFVLSTDISGFVLRTKGNNAVGLRNTVVELYNHRGELLNTQKSDQDGYYEFLALAPGSYVIRIAEKTLIEKGYTSEVIGFKISTNKGGYLELPIIKLQKKHETTIKSKELIKLVTSTEDNTDIVVWDDDENVRKNYFTLPTKNDITAKYTLDEAEEVEQAKQAETKVVPVRKPLPKTAKAGFAFLASGNMANGVLPSVSIGKPIKRSDTLTSVKDQPLSEVAEDNDVLVTPYNKVTKQKRFYTIQLGAFSAKEDAEFLKRKLANANLSLNDFNVSKDPIKNVYRLSYGDFITKNDATNFAKENLEKEQSHYIRQLNTQEPAVKTEPMKSNNNGWVVQLYSAYMPFSQTSLSSKFSGIGTLYSAQKNIKNNDYLYCLISEPFATKNDAKNAIKNSGLSGWPVKQSSYYKIQAIN